MAKFKFENFASSTLAAGIASGDTTLNLAAGTGVKFPTLAAGEYFMLKVINSAKQAEIVKVTGHAAASDQLTVERAQEGTTARAYLSGDVVQLILSKGLLAKFGVADERNVWAGSQVVSLVALTDAATINTDASLSDVFSVTLGGNRTLANPTNLVAGQTVVWFLDQDATGGRTISFGSLFKFPSAVVPSLSSPANAKDTLTCIYDGTILRCNLSKAFG